MVTTRQSEKEKNTDETEETVDTSVISTEETSTSDNDSAERPVRRKLEETSITPTSAPHGAGIEEGLKMTDAARDTDPTRSSSRGRKRHADDEEPEQGNDNADLREGSTHRRKRSRDSKPEDDTKEVDHNVCSTPPNLGDETSTSVLSPKKKRSRDQLDNEEASVPEDATTEPAKAHENGSAVESARADGEPEKKRHRDDSREREPAAKAQPSVTSAFSNTSAVSPFGSLGSSRSSCAADDKVPPTETPAATSAFATSSLAAFAGSETSPFGTIGNSATSVFKAASPNVDTAGSATGFAAKSTASPFASAGTSGFASLGGGFSGFGGGFTAAGKSGGGLTSFASPSGPGLLGNNSSKVKAFGAADEEEEDGEEEPEEAEAEPGTKGFEKEKPDERFQQQQPVQTGEEDEKTYFSCKAKLFSFQGKEWKERGTGTFKVNVKEPEEGEEGKLSARMIMRADGVLRLMLNTKIFKEMTIGDAQGNEPKEKRVNLQAMEEGRPVPLLLRNAEIAKELYHVIRDLQERL